MRAIFTVIICLAFGSTKAYADPEKDYRNSIDKIGSEIKQISRNLNANEKLLKTEQDRLFDTERKLQDLQKKIEKTNLSLEQKQTEIKRLDSDLDDAKKSQKSNQEAFKRLLESRYKQGKPDYLKRFINQENPYAVGRLKSYYEYFSAALRTRFSELEAQIAKTQAIHAEHQKAMSELVAERDKQYELQNDWQDTKKERAKSVAKLNSKVGASKEKLGQLEKDRERLDTLLKTIAAQAAELRRIEQARQEKERLERLEREKQQASSPKPATGTQAPTKRVPVKGGFLKQKGRLSFPVAAKPKTKYGSRLPASGMTSEGMFFDTDGSIPVTSVFRGRILFADFLKGYGLLMIVDHGDDHISLYGHNELLYKQVGDTVDTNEVIAKTGVTGGLKSTGLYFEIRKDANPVNPELWCK